MQARQGHLARSGRVAVRLGCAAALVVALSACDALPGRAAPTASPSPAPTRLEEVRDARAVVDDLVPGPVAAARAAAAAVERARTATDLGASRERLAALRALDVPALREDAARLAGASVDGDGPDVTAARAALDALADAVDAVAAGVRVERRQLASLAEVDEALAGLVAEWDARGQRSEQEQRLVAATERARELRRGLATPERVLACIGAWPRRDAAARTVVARSGELAALTSGATGIAFDERRDEWRGDPYDVGAATLAAADAAAAGADGCWAGASPTAAALVRLDVALADLQASLTPEDL